MVHHFRHLFTPHDTNNHRPRILHPAGLLVLIAVFILFQSWTQLFKYALVSAPQGYILGFASSIFPQQVVEQTNAQRAMDGLPPLSLNQQLTEAAAGKANHMFANNYWAHVAPDGTTPWVFIKNAGYRYSVAGENLARDFGDTGSMIGAWMNSPTHRENIMNPKYSQIGVAVVDGVLEGSETTLVVQMFGNPTGDFPRTTDLAAISEPKPTTPNPRPTKALIVAAATPTSAPIISPTLTPAPEAIALIEPGKMARLEPADLSRETAAGNFPLREIILSPLTLTKAVGAAIILLMAGVLLYDEYHTHKHKIPRSVSKNWAHLALLAFVLMILAAVTQGRIPAGDIENSQTVMGANTLITPE